MVKVADGDMNSEIVDEVNSGIPLSLANLLGPNFQDCCVLSDLPLEFSDVRKHEHGVNEEFIFMTVGSSKFVALDRYLNVASLEKRLRGNS